MKSWRAVMLMRTGRAVMVNGQWPMSRATSSTRCVCCVGPRNRLSVGTVSVRAVRGKPGSPHGNLSEVDAAVGSDELSEEENLSSLLGSSPVYILGLITTSSVTSRHI